MKTERNNYFLIDTNKLPFQLYSAFGDFSIKKNQIRLISLVDHLMNHVMFLAPLDISARELTWDVLQPFESIFQLFHLLSQALARSASWHSSVLFRLLSPALADSLSLLSWLLVCRFLSASVKTCIANVISTMLSFVYITKETTFLLFNSSKGR